MDISEHHGAMNSLPRKMPLGAYKQEFHSPCQKFPHTEAHPCMKVKKPFQQRVGLQNCLCTASSSEQAGAQPLKKDRAVVDMT